MIGELREFLSTYRKAAGLFAAAAVGAIVVGGGLGASAFLRDVSVDDVTSDWRLPDTNLEERTATYSGITMQNKWVIDQRVALRREREERQTASVQEQEANEAWTLLGLIEEDGTRYAVIQTQGSPQLAYRQVGEVLPTGEIIIALSETSMSAESPEGAQEFRLFTRD